MKKVILALVDNVLNFVHFPIYVNSLEEFFQKIDKNKGILIRKEYSFLRDPNFFSDDLALRLANNPFSENMFVTLELTNYSEKRKVCYSYRVVSVFGGIMRFNDMKIGPKRIDTVVVREKNRIIKKLKGKFPEIVILVSL